MCEKSQIALKSLLEHFHPENAEKLLSHLPSSLAQQIGDLAPLQDHSVHAYATPIGERLARIHYSWLASLVANQPPELQLHFVASLPKPLQQPCEELLHVEGTLPKLSEGLQHCFERFLYNRLETDEILPERLLPSSPLNRLLDLDKRTLVRTIALLGLYDIAAAMRQILHSDQRKKIQEALPPIFRRYLLRCLRTTDPLVERVEGLPFFLESAPRLQRLCQERGLRRLGIALSTAHPSLIWHIMHRLDRERGKRVVEIAEGKFEGNLQRAATNQVSDVLQFLLTLREKA